jgi:hypothetical protein
VVRAAELCSADSRGRLPPTQARSGLLTGLGARVRNDNWSTDDGARVLGEAPGEQH